MLFTKSRFFFLLLNMLALTVILNSCKSSQKTTSIPDKTTETVVAPKPSPAKEPVQEKPKETNPRFNVVLVLPFELKSNFTVTDEGITEPEVKQSSLPALHFYEGALIAADSLNSSGRDISITSVEAPVDSAGLSRLFSNQSIKDAGLVIASLPNSLASAASAIAEKYGINLVLTQASSPDFLEGKKNIALAYPSTVTQCKEFVSSLLEKNPVSNILLIYRTVKREHELAEFFRSAILKDKGSNEFREINATDKGYNDVIKYLSKSKRNLVFVVSSDEAFISPLLALIEEQNIYGVQLNGLPTWQNFESVDFMDFKNIQVNIFDNNFINYSDPARISFRKTFLNRYFADPLPSAFNGFDLVYRIASGAGSAKPGLHKLIEKSFGENTPDFKFKEFNAGGFENKYISILHFNDYQLEMVPVK